MRSPRLGRLTAALEALRKAEGKKMWVFYKRALEEAGFRCSYGRSQSGRKDSPMEFWFYPDGLDFDKREWLLVKEPMDIIPDVEQRIEQERRYLEEHGRTQTHLRRLVGEIEMRVLRQYEKDSAMEEADDVRLARFDALDRVREVLNALTN